MRWMQNHCSFVFGLFDSVEISLFDDLCSMHLVYLFFRNVYLVFSFFYGIRYFLGGMYTDFFEIFDFQKITLLDVFVVTDHEYKNYFFMRGICTKIYQENYNFSQYSFFPLQFVSLSLKNY